VSEKRAAVWQGTFGDRLLGKRPFLGVLGRLRLGEFLRHMLVTQDVHHNVFSGGCFGMEKRK
jgi:hypothetical protein